MIAFYIDFPGIWRTLCYIKNMSGFSFGNINTRAKKGTLNLLTTDKVELSSKGSTSDPNFINILLDVIPAAIQLSVFEKWLENNKVFNYKIFYAITCLPTQKELDKLGVIEVYKHNAINFSTYLEPGAPVITFGPALYSLLQEDDIYPNHVEQVIFGKSNFWFSKDLTAKGWWVYPATKFYDIVEGSASKIRDSYRTKLAALQLAKILNLGRLAPPRYPRLNKIFITSPEEFHEKFYLPNKDRHDEVLAWDLETSGLRFWKDRIGCITLSFDGVTGYYVPWKCVIKDELNEILGNNKQLGANIKFDVKWLWRNGVPNAHIDEDVILLGHVMDEERSNSLKALAFYYSEYGGYERPLDDYKAKLGKGKDISYTDDIPEDLLKEYAIMDAIVTKRVWVNMMKHVKELDKVYPNELFPDNGMLEYYYDRHIPAANMYAGIEFRGFHIDVNKLAQLRKDMNDHRRSLEDKLVEMFNVNRNFPWTSAEELGKLIEKKGWTDWGRNEKGIYATANFQLTRWAKEGHEEARILQSLRSMNTLLGMFVGDGSGENGWPKYIVHHPEDGTDRLHPDYYSMQTDSGRTKCSRPNMQQVPTRNADKTVEGFVKRIKGCLKTPDDENFYLVTVDYSALQARLGAMDTRDIKDPLVRVLRSEEADMHSSTAWSCFCVKKKYNIMTVTVEQDGKEYKFLGGEMVRTRRGEVPAQDLKEDDELIFD